MPLVNGLVAIEDIMEKLDLAELPEDCLYTIADALRLEVDVSQSEIDDHATEDDSEPECISVDQGDLRDGLRALLAGDRPMARILLGRALETDVDAVRAIEEELR